MSESSPDVVQLFFRTLALELRANRHIQSSTIACYLSHMTTLLTEQGWHFAPHVHSPLLSRMLSGWRREDILNKPARLSEQIPATCAVMVRFFDVAARIYANNPRLLAEVQACGAIMYCSALRPGEAAATTVSGRDEEDTSHHLRTDAAFVRFPDDPTKFYPVTEGTVFPHGKIPSSFDFHQDSSKNNDRGAGHVTIFPNPNPGKTPFCAVDILWRYISAFPPPPGGAFFPDILASTISNVMHVTATELSLDPRRMSARAIRPGSTSMIRSVKNNLLQQTELAYIAAHGRWNTDMSGTYSHDCVDSRGQVIAPSLYNDRFMTINYLVWYYMTPIARPLAR